jgi:DNA-binding ferritin-like protein (Dps family)
MENKKYPKSYIYTDEYLENIYNLSQSEKSKRYIPSDKIDKWLEQRKIAYVKITEYLHKYGFDEVQELLDVGNFNLIYIRVANSIDTVKDYSKHIEWDKEKEKNVVATVIQAILMQEKFDNSNLTKANYYREVESLKNRFQKLQWEYQHLIKDINEKLNQFYPEPFKKSLDIPLHPNDNYKIALDMLIRMNIEKTVAMSLLEVALDMNNVKQTIYMKKRKDTLNNEMSDRVDELCSHLPKNSKKYLKKIIKSTINPAKKP